MPDIPGLDQVDYFTNSTLLDVDFVPPHLIVIGGSYIGLEFAQIFRRFGSEVTVLEMAPRLIAREDEDVSAAVADILRGGRHRRSTSASRDLKLAQARRGHRASAFAAGGASEGSSARICSSPSAVGPIPMTSASTRPASPPTSAGFIEVDDQLRTNVPGIWALGDCNGRGAFTHTAYNDFEIVAANLLDNDPRRVSDRITAYNLYTDPPLGRVGLTEAEVRKSGRPALMATMAMEDVSRAFEKGETQGFMKILVDAETQADSRRIDPRRRRRRGDPFHPRPHVRQGALHGDAARHAHPPDGVGVAAHHAGRSQASRIADLQQGEPWHDPGPR